ncbi:MAG: hypothetical protein PVF66_04375 [Candidatus Aminicenantes bacterium]|jgi:hypothetical protein
MNRKATDIGLYLARAIINDYEANLEIDNELEGETTPQMNVFHL